MLDLALRKFGVKARLTIKGAVSVLMVALAVALPQIAHVVGGPTAGGVWLPMYAPALLAGCLLGSVWGLGVGVLSPVVSFGFTSLVFGNAMPAAARLPQMIIELALFGGISGLFVNKIRENSLVAFPAVMIAQVSGRAVFVIYNLIAGNPISAVWASVQTGMVGLFLQAIIVPLAVIVLARALARDKEAGDE